MAGVLGKRLDIQMIGRGIASNGQIKPAEKISGIELINTTNVTNSRRGVTEPSQMPHRQEASKKGSRSSNKCPALARVLTPCEVKLAPK